MLKKLLFESDFSYPVWAVISIVAFYLIYEWYLKGKFHTELEKELDENRQALNEKSDVFKRKLKLLEDFFIQEYLEKKLLPLTEDKSRSLRYYGQIGLFGRISTLKSIVDSSGTELLFMHETSELYKVSNILACLRKELNPKANNDDETLIRYVFMLENIAGEKVHQIIEMVDHTNYQGNAESTDQIKNLKFEFISLDSLIEDLKLGNYVPKLERGNDFKYIRIGDIEDYISITPNLYKLLPGVCSYSLKNSILISVRGTVGKLGYIEEMNNVVVSSNLCYGEISSDIDKDYLGLIRDTDYIKSQLRFISTGVAQQFVRVSDLTKIMIPTLSSEQQKTLVELFKNTDRHIILSEVNKILPAPNMLVFGSKTFSKLVYEKLKKNQKVKSITLGSSEKEDFKNMNEHDFLVELADDRKLFVDVKYHGLNKHCYDDFIKSKEGFYSKDQNYIIVTPDNYESLDGIINIF